MDMSETKAQQGHRWLWQPRETWYKEYRTVHRNPDHPDHGRLLGLAFAAKPDRVTEDGHVGLVIPPQARGRLYSPAEERMGGHALYEGFANLILAATGEKRLDGSGYAACLNPGSSAIDIVAKFVERYGLLVQREASIVCCEEADWTYKPRGAGEPGRFNSVRSVLIESLVMRRALAVSRALAEVQKSGKPHSVTDLWTVAEGERWLFEAGNPEWLSNGRWETELRISMRYLREVIHSHVRHARIGFAIDPVPMRTVPRRITAFEYEETFDYGDGLLGNLWAQFARAELPGVAVGRTCLECGNPFEPERSDQLYCSKTCGGRHRMRRSRAQRAEVPDDFDK